MRYRLQHQACTRGRPHPGAFFIVCFLGAIAACLGAAALAQAAASNSTLSGSYGVYGFNTDFVEPAMWTERINVDYDGNGNFTFRSLDVGDQFSSTYSVGADGHFSTASLGVHGAVSPDGRVYYRLLADPSVPYIFMESGVRKGSGLSNATLQGSYWMFAYMSQGENGVASTMVEEQNFNGAGTATWTRVAASNQGADSGTLSYSVSSDGTYVSADGNTHITVSDNGGFYAGNITDYGVPTIARVLAIKKGSGLSNATLSGSFHMGVYGASNNLLDPWSGWLDCSFDGNGNYTWIALESSGPNRTVVSRQGTYSVASDGTVSLDNGFWAIVSADGNNFIMVDVNAADGEVSMGQAVKKSQ